MEFNRASSVIYTILVCFNIGFCLEHEPRFSLHLHESEENGDSVERIWQKLASLEDTLTTTLSSINAKLDEHASEKATLLTDIETFKADIQEEIGAFKDGADDVMKQQATEHEQFMKDMSTKYDTMVEQTDERIQQIQADLLNTSRNNNTPQYQTGHDCPVIAFSVGLTNSTYPAHGDRLVYDLVFIDLGHAYNNVTGEFLAPVAGLYEFHYHVLADRHKAVWLELVHNDRKASDDIGYINSLFCRVPSGYGAAGNTAIIDMDAEDVVYVRASGNTALYGRTDQIYCTFSGHLLHQRE